MSWYDSEEEARKQITWKEKEYGTEFEVVEGDKIEINGETVKTWWCLRKNRG